MTDEPGEIPEKILQDEKDAIASMRSGNYEHARYVMARLCKDYPKIARFHFNYALALYRMKEYDAALEEVDVGLKLAPDDEKALRFKSELIILVPGNAPVILTQESGSRNPIIRGNATQTPEPIPDEAKRPPTPQRQGSWFNGTAMLIDDTHPVRSRPTISTKNALPLNPFRRPWWLRRGNHVCAWWVANPTKRGLAVTSLVFIVLSAALGTVVLTNAATYQLEYRYCTTYTDQTSIKTIRVTIPRSTYAAYKGYPHAISTGAVSEYEAFCNIDYMWYIAIQIKNSLGFGANDERVIAAILSFVQDKCDGLGGLHYQYDPSQMEYPKYPVETLVDGGGDCEDLSILFASLVESIGYQAVLIMIPDVSHMIAGIALSSAPAHNNGTVYYLDVGSTRYYTCECTIYGWNVGVIDDNLASYICYSAEVTI